MSYKEIARDLKVSTSTVRNHLQSIYKKLGISNKVELSNMLAMRPV
jgi:DNA-binding CsgD family transcriptional regulator